MRRFFVWSALAAVIGLALAIGGFWAYQHFWARFLPVTITRDQAEIQRLLDASSWVSDGGGGQPLYIVGYRDSQALQGYEREEVPKLEASGVEARYILFARPDREGQVQSTAAERATVAELWLSRDWSLYQRWMATPSNNWTAAGLPASDGNMARSAVVDASRQFVLKLSDALSANGLQVRYPLVIWRDREGFLKACACTDSRSWAHIRDDLGARDPGAVSPADEPASPTEPGAPAVDGGLPYPTLPPIPPAAGQTPVAPGVDDAPVVTPAPMGAVQPAPRVAPRAAPRQAPQPTKQDDTTFY